jgi:ArsR family transcriptional regulator
MGCAMRTLLPTDFGRHAGDAAALLKSMANERRLLVLCHLAVSDEISVGELADRVGLSQSALSQHLARLREEGLVATRREAQTVHYRIGEPKAGQLLALLHDLFCPDLGRDSDPTPTGAGDGR